MYIGGTAEYEAHLTFIYSLAFQSPHPLTKTWRKKTHLQKPLLTENAAVCKFARWESMETACKARSNSTVGLLAD